MCSLFFHFRRSSKINLFINKSIHITMQLSGHKSTANCNFMTKWGLIDRGNILYIVVYSIPCRIWLTCSVVSSVPSTYSYSPLLSSVQLLTILLHFLRFFPVFQRKRHLNQTWCKTVVTPSILLSITINAETCYILYAC